MAVLPVLTFPHPLLKQKSQSVTVFDDGLRALADAMLETMYAEFGIGLAAVQVGQLKRLIVVDVPEGYGDPDAPEPSEAPRARRPSCYVNPRIVASSGEIITEEGCLSVVEFTAEVRRAEEVEVEFETLEGETRSEALSGHRAVCVQHEIDHTEGKLFIDHLPPIKRQLVKKRLAKLARSA